MSRTEAKSFVVRQWSFDEITESEEERRKGCKTNSAGASSDKLQGGAERQREVQAGMEKLQDFSSKLRGNRTTNFS